MEWNKVPNVLFFWKDIMISPSLTDSLFLVTFKALFPLLLLMGGCAPEMCLYGTRLEFWTECFKKDNQTFVLLCSSHSARCDSEPLLDQSTGAEVWPPYWWHRHIDSPVLSLCSSFCLAVLDCNWKVLQSDFREAFWAPLFHFHCSELVFNRINMASNWNGHNIQRSYSNIGNPFSLFTMFFCSVGCSVGNSC